MTDWQPGDRVDVLDRDEEVWAPGVVERWTELPKSHGRYLMVRADGHPFNRTLSNVYLVPANSVRDLVRPRSNRKGH